MLLKRKGIITNGSVHRNKRIVLNYDLENFFDSFHFGRVRGYFWKQIFSHESGRGDDNRPVDLLSGNRYKARLRPIITNMICEIFDFKLLAGQET
ncbi:MAG: hypothetical protein ACLTK0_07480 [Anaerovoracaceae bacterium]